jgi:hypothetical protein
MRRGWAFSIGVHALALLIVLFGLPFFHPQPHEVPPMISVDVVDMAKEATTNKIAPANKVEKQVQEETPPPQQAKPQPTPEPVKPPPPTPPRETVDTSIPKLAAVDSAAPELKAPDVNLKRPLDPLPDLPSVDSKVADVAPPAPTDLKRPQPKENFDSVLKNLAKLKPRESPAQPQQQPNPKAEAKPATGALAQLSDKLTQSELAALNEQLSRCWNLPSGVKDAQNLVIDLDVEVNPDRTVASVQVEDQARLASDPVFRAAAMSAVRALRMPECSPLALPPDKHDQWQSMVLRFNPKEMLGL